MLYVREADLHIYVDLVLYIISTAVLNYYTSVIIIFICITFILTRPKITMLSICKNIIVKPVHHSGGLGQLMGVVHKRTRAQALQTDRKKTACSLRRNWN